MAGITLAQAEAKLSEYLNAETAVLAGKQFRMGEKMVTYEDLAIIQRGIKIWDGRVKRLSGGGGIRIWGRNPNMKGFSSRTHAVTPNVIDKIIEYFSPTHAARRMRARLALSIANSYDGASKFKRTLRQWATFGYDADTDILVDLPELRNRSRDLMRNNPLASGAIKTKLTNVIGSGLRLRSHIDRGSHRIDRGCGRCLGAADGTGMAPVLGIEGLRTWRAPATAWP